VNNPRPSFVDAAHAITWILRFFPSFCLAKGLYFIINIEYVQWVEGENRLNAWSEAVMLVDAIYLAWESIVYLALAIQIDKWSTNPRVMRLWKKFCCFCGKKPAFVEADITTSFPQDDDVVAEQERVLTGEAKSDLIVLSQLTKVFDNGTVAVNNVRMNLNIFWIVRHSHLPILLICRCRWGFLVESALACWVSMVRTASGLRLPVFLNPFLNCELFLQFRSREDNGTSNGHCRVPSNQRRRNACGVQRYQ